MLGSFPSKWTATVADPVLSELVFVPICSLTVRGMPGTCNSKGVLVSIEEIAESKLTFEHEEWKQAALVTPQIKFEENRNSFGQKKTLPPTELRVQRIHKVQEKLTVCGNVKCIWKRIRLGTTHDNCQFLQLPHVISSFANVLAPWNCEHSVHLECEKCIEMSCRVTVPCERWT